MSAQYERLTDEIGTTRDAIRRYEAQGHQREAELAHERLAGLLFAEHILFGDGKQSCRHLKHSFLGTNEVGVNVWACDGCGDLFPAGAAHP